MSARDEAHILGYSLVVVSSDRIGTCCATVRAQEPIATDALVQFFQLQEASLNSTWLELRQVQHSGKESPEAPQTFSDDEFVHETRVRCVAMGPRYRYEKTYARTNENCAVFLGKIEVGTWNGAQARTSISKPSGATSVGITELPPLTHRIEPFFSWLGKWVVQMPKLPTYTVALQDRLFEGPTLEDDGRTRWRCLVDPDYLDIELVLYAARIAGQVRLVEAQLRAYTGGTDVHASPMPEDDQTFGISVVTFDWAQTLSNTQVLLPAVATIEHRNRRATPEESFWHSTQITLLSAETSVIDPEIFLAELPDGARVSDEHYQIGYQVGDVFINLDGRAVKTHRPIDGCVGDKLEWWVSRGELGPVVEPRRDQLVNPASGRASSDKEGDGNDD